MRCRSRGGHLRVWGAGLGVGGWNKVIGLVFGGGGGDDCGDDDEERRRAHDFGANFVIGGG